jgi:hypothetical protein
VTSHRSATRAQENHRLLLGSLTLIIIFRLLSSRESELLSRVMLKWGKLVLQALAWRFTGAEHDLQIDEECHEQLGSRGETCGTP